MDGEHIEMIISNWSSTELRNKAFPTACILEANEIWKSFRGGASIANSSHWYVRFTVPGLTYQETNP